MKAYKGMHPRKRRHLRLRKKIHGSPERLRLAVFRSLNHIAGQLIDDDQGKTVMGLTSFSKMFEGKLKHGGNVAAAKTVGEALAKQAVAKGIKKVVFDRGGYAFHGRIKAFAEAARAAGLEF